MTRYTKFRDVGGGVMWPFTIQRERNGEKIFEIFSESVSINQGLTDNLFTLPSGMKVLGGLAFFDRADEVADSPDLRRVLRDGLR